MFNSSQTQESSNKIIWAVAILAATVFFGIIISQNKKESEQFLNLVSPSGGEEICFGDEYDIAWKASSDVKEVKVRIENAETDRDYSIGTFPIDKNQGKVENASGMYTWQAGLLEDRWLPAGEAYHIRLFGQYSEKEGNETVQYPVRDTNEEPFALVDC